MLVHGSACGQKLFDSNAIWRKELHVLMQADSICVTCTEYVILQKPSNLYKELGPLLPRIAGANRGTWDGPAIRMPNGMPFNAQYVPDNLNQLRQQCADYRVIAGGSAQRCVFCKVSAIHGVLHVELSVPPVAVPKIIVENSLVVTASSARDDFVSRLLSEVGIWPKTNGFNVVATTNIKTTASSATAGLTNAPALEAEKSFTLWDFVLNRFTLID